MSSAGEKAAHEQEVFGEFSAAVGLSLDTDSVQSGDESREEPDICCRISGEPYHFELGRLADPEIPKLRLEALRRALRGDPTHVRVDASAVGFPPTDMLRQKTAKSYNTGGAPVDLVLYYDTNPLLADFEPPPGFASLIPMLTSILEEERGPFQRVWFFCRHRKRSLWRYP